jgi:hypothetical protein
VRWVCVVWVHGCLRACVWLWVVRSVPPPPPSPTSHTTKNLAAPARKRARRAAGRAGPAAAGGTKALGAPGSTTNTTRWTCGTPGSRGSGRAGRVLEGSSHACRHHGDGQCVHLFPMQFSRAHVVHVARTSFCWPAPQRSPPDTVPGRPTAPRPPMQGCPARHRASPSRARWRRSCTTCRAPACGTAPPGSRQAARSPSPCRRARRRHLPRRCRRGWRSPCCRCAL